MASTKKEVNALTLLEEDDEFEVNIMLCWRYCRKMGNEEMNILFK